MPPSPPSIYFEIKCTFICARERGERREIESYFEFIIAQQPYWGAPNAMRACDTSLSLSQLMAAVLVRPARVRRHVSAEIVQCTLVTVADSPSSQMTLMAHARRFLSSSAVSCSSTIDRVQMGYLRFGLCSQHGT
jgi:hypothetical protein